MPGYNPTATPVNSRTTLTITTGSGPLTIGSSVISGSCPPVTETTNTQNKVRDAYWLKTQADTGKPLILQRVDANGNLDAEGNSLLITSPDWEGRSLLLAGGHEHVDELGLTLEPGVAQVVFSPDGDAFEATGIEGGGKYGPSLARNGDETAIAYSVNDPANGKTNARVAFIKNGAVIADIVLADSVDAEFAYNVIPQEDGGYLIPVTTAASNTVPGGVGTRIELYRVSPAPTRTVTSVWNAPAVSGVGQARTRPYFKEFSDGKKLLIWEGRETSADARVVRGTIINADYSTNVIAQEIGPRGDTSATSYIIEPISANKFLYIYRETNGKLRLSVRNLDSSFSLSAPEVDVKSGTALQSDPVISIDKTTGKIYITFSEYVDTFRSILYNAEFSLNESGALVAGSVRMIDDQIVPGIVEGSNSPSADWINDQELLITYQRPLAMYDTNVYTRRLNVVTGVVSEEVPGNPMTPGYTASSFPSQPGQQGYPKLATNPTTKKGTLVYNQGEGPSTTFSAREFEDGHVSDPIRVVDTPGQSVIIKDGTWVFMQGADITLQLTSTEQKNVFLDSGQQYSLLLTSGTSAKRDVAKREGETPKLTITGLTPTTVINRSPDLSGELQFMTMGNGTVLSIGGVNYAEFRDTPVQVVQQALGVTPTTPPAPTPPAPTPEEPTPPPVPVPAPTPTPTPPVEEPAPVPEPVSPPTPVEEPSSPPTEVPVPPTTPPVTPTPAPSAQPPSGEVTPPPQPSSGGRLQPPSIFRLPGKIVDATTLILGWVGTKVSQNFLAPANTNAEPKVEEVVQKTPQVVASSSDALVVQSQPTVTVEQLSEAQSAQGIALITAQFVENARAKGWAVDFDNAQKVFTHGEFTVNEQGQVTPSQATEVELTALVRNAQVSQCLSNAAYTGAQQFVKGFVEGLNISNPQTRAKALLAVEVGGLASNAYLFGLTSLPLGVARLANDTVVAHYAPSIYGITREMIDVGYQCLMATVPGEVLAVSAVAGLAANSIGRWTAQQLAEQEQEKAQQGNAR